MYLRPTVVSQYEETMKVVTEKRGFFSRELENLLTTS